jgi:hypothetical protein
LGSVAGKPVEYLLTAILDPTRSCASQKLIDLRPEGLAGLAAVVFPVFERSGADSEFRCNLPLSRARSQSPVQQQLAQTRLPIIEKWRIMPYGLDQQMAKRAQKEPLPPIL